MNLRVLGLLFLISLKLPVLQQIPVEEPEENAGTLALLFGVWLVKYVGEHVIVLDGKRASFKVFFMAHDQGEGDILNDQNEH
jgi:hypothetical protein